MSEIPNPIKRGYNISDLEMLEDSTTVQVIFLEDLPLFQTFDNNFDAAYADNWLTAINVGNTFPTDEVYRDQMRTKTTDVQAEMAKARKKYNEIKFFVRKAFPDKSGIQGEFGLDDYDQARQSDTKLHGFMNTLFQAATKYATTLTTPPVGYTAAQIAEINTIAIALNTSNTAQETFIKAQGTTTQDRITAMNAVYAFRTLVAEAAKIIFEDNFAKYQQYLLPASDSNPEDYAILGTVTDASTNAPLAEVRIQLSGLVDAEVLTNSKGKYGFADNLPPGDYTLTIEKLDYAPSTKTVTVLSADETVTVNASLSLQ